MYAKLKGYLTSSDPKETIRITVFTVVAFGIGLLNVQYLKTHIYWLDLLIRLPQAIVLGYIYKKFIKKTPMVTKVDKWRLKGIPHYVLFISGLFIYFGVITFKYVHSIKTTNDLSSGLSDLSDVGHKYSVFQFTLILVGAFMMAAPVYYTLIQSIFYLRIFTVWIFNNHPKWYGVSLMMEEILLISFATLIY